MIIFAITFFVRPILIKDVIRYALWIRFALMFKCKIKNIMLTHYTLALFKHTNHPFFIKLIMVFFNFCCCLVKFVADSRSAVYSCAFFIAFSETKVAF